MMEETSDEILRRALGPGERLLWLGKPKTRFPLRSQDAFLIAFSVFLCACACAILWEITAFNPDSSSPSFVNPGPPPPLWGTLRGILPGIPFLCAGLVFVQLIIDARLRERTAYGVTDERVLIVSGLFSPRITSLQLTSLSGKVTLKQEASGRGTIFFGPPEALIANGPGPAPPGYTRGQLPAFKRIEDAKST
jgi:hypothetical protein